MNEPHFRIGIDFDDVLVRTAEYTARLYNAAHGTALTRDDWYDFRSMQPWGVEALPEAVQRVEAIMHSDEFTELEPLQGAEHALLKLKKFGHDLLIVTGRPESLRFHTLAVSQRRYPGAFEERDMHFTHHFGTQAKKQSKGEVAVELGLTHFIDDQIEHANSVAAAGIQSILFSDNYTWNQAPTAPEVIRVGSWQEIEQYFDDQQRAA